MITMTGAADSTPSSDLYDPDMAKRKLIGIQEARDKFRERVDAATTEDEHSIVARRGKALVAVVPMAWYRRMCELDGDPTEF